MQSVFNGIVHNRISLSRKTCQADLAGYTHDMVDLVIFSEQKEFYETIDKYFDFFMEECKIFPDMSREKIIDAKNEALSLVALYAVDQTQDKYQRALDAYNVLKANL